MSVEITLLLIYLAGIVTVLLGFATYHYRSGDVKRQDVIKEVVLAIFWPLILLFLLFG